MSSSEQRPVSIVTGSSRGIGFEIGKQLALHHGHAVVLTGSNLEKLKQAHDEISKEGGVCSYVCVDLSKPFSEKNPSHPPAYDIFQHTLQHHSKIDHLICNAAVLGAIEKISDFSTEQLTHELYQSYQVNILSVMQLCHYCLPELRKSAAMREPRRGGNILLVSTGLAVKAFEGTAMYGTTKAALNHFATYLDCEEKLYAERTFSDEPQQRRVKIVAIQPGMVDTDMQRDVRESGKNKMNEYGIFVSVYEKGQLESAEKIGKILSCVVNDMKVEWSGTFKSYQHEDVLELYKKSYGVL
ncbi:hypothetical protein C9374_002529 [Naegleria lovaniensis]|uniref:NAD(P)-binding protein n=1 Tax=Naegleria lovaniensis TaxID=51637 RepID=A0AA88GU66_NAELO|nr:uncharacterized protein C9374_002529 [Naegleria lovaniensis]KAG2386083.1 hypothetical protein C9374_002529 [Naegleria lovaniensis]